MRENVLFLGCDVRGVGEREAFVPVSIRLSFDPWTCLRLRQRDLHKLLSSTEDQLPREKKYTSEKSGRLWWVPYPYIAFRFDDLSSFQINRQVIGKSSTKAEEIKRDTVFRDDGKKQRMGNVWNSHQSVSNDTFGDTIGNRVFQYLQISSNRNYRADFIKLMFRLYSVLFARQLFHSMINIC